jgi:hypothetical protein
MDDTVDDHLDSLLKTIMAHEEKTGERVEADFITWRGMMTKVGSTCLNTQRQLLIHLSSWLPFLATEMGKNYTSVGKLRLLIRLLALK